MVERRATAILLVAAVVLLVAATALLASGRLLAALGDDAGTAVVDRAAVVSAVLLAVDVVCLVMLQSYLFLRMWEPPEGEE